MKPTIASRAKRVQQVEKRPPTAPNISQSQTIHVNLQDLFAPISQPETIDGSLLEDLLVPLHPPTPQQQQPRHMPSLEDVLVQIHQHNSPDYSFLDGYPTPIDQHVSSLCLCC